ncbi:hypothetical protein HK097_001855, partial [Rhizophlyctis rosea]
MSTYIQSRVAQMPKPTPTNPLQLLTHEERALREAESRINMSVMHHSVGDNPSRAAAGFRAQKGEKKGGRK